MPKSSTDLFIDSLIEIRDKRAFNKLELAEISARYPGKKMAGILYAYWYRLQIRNFLRQYKWPNRVIIGVLFVAGIYLTLYSPVYSMTAGPLLMVPAIVGARYGGAFNASTVAVLQDLIDDMVEEIEDTEHEKISRTRTPRRGTTRDSHET